MANVYAPPPPPSYRKALVLGALGLASFLAVEALFLRAFTREDRRPPSWDQSVHLEIALDYREALAEGRLGDLWHLAPKPGMPAFPPLYHLLQTRAYSFADPAHAALWLNGLYLALLAAAVFGIAFHFRPDAMALCASIIFCASPGVQELLTMQLVDLPLTALAAAAYWALLASDGFREWPGALLFALLHAAGMLHKWSFFSYMLPAYAAVGLALGERRTAPLAAGCALLSAALTAPWYSSHLLLMPSRLVQASSDFAVSAAHFDSWLVYVRQESAALGPALLVLGAVGLAAPQHPRRRQDGWLLVAWTLAGWVFWTLVPNRQWRFLLPALPPLAVCLVSTWPKPVSWGVAGFQLLALANFYGGFVGPLSVPIPGLPLTTFYNRPARDEDWHVDEILTRVEAERDPSRPLANMTLVANDEYFNAPTFNWTRRRLKLGHARVRGVNKRLCELSEFVLVKSPRLGPPSVIPGLPEAAAEIEERGGWFSRAYEPDGEWALPDGGKATLYRQRRRLRPPLPRRDLFFDYVALGGAVIEKLRLRAGAWSDASSSYDAVGLAARTLSVHGLAVRGAAAELDDLSFVNVTDPVEGTWNDVRLLKLGRLKIASLSVEAADVKAFLENRVKGLQLATLELDGGAVRAAGRFKGVSVSAEARLELLDSPRRLAVRPVSLKLGGVPLPVSSLREIKELIVPLEPSPETPFFIDVPSLTIAGGRLSVP